MAGGSNEQSPLLARQHSDGSNTHDENTEQISFSKEDKDDPKQWSYRQKMTNVTVIALMALLSPLASSMFSPGMSQIAEDLGVPQQSVVGATTGFVVMLGIGPLVLAPLSETFGRRILYLVCFTIFSLLQVPAALSPNLACLLTVRTLAGFFGSVGIANGGGTISDMFKPSERAGIFGWYLLGVLAGPCIGPLLGGVIVEKLGWRWIFWFLTILCAVNTLLGFAFLKESYAPVLLRQRCLELEKEDDSNKRYTYEGQDSRPLTVKLAESLRRPVRILFTQPIVFAMATFQALIFASMYTLYTNMQTIFSKPPYNFSTAQVGALYLGPGLGFLLAVWFLVPRIDQIFKKMTEKNNGVEQPEFRLPLANVGSVLLPISLTAFGWTVDRGAPWLACIATTFFFGIGQVAVFNTAQNYYIDAFAKYAASAIAAGALFRSLIGGVVPLFAPALFDKLGYGWGWTVYGAFMLAIAPCPLLFQRYGRQLRERFAIEL